MESRPAERPRQGVRRRHPRQAVELHRKGADGVAAARELREAIRGATRDAACASGGLGAALDAVRFLVRTRHGARWFRIGHTWVETEHGAAVAAFRFRTTSAAAGAAGGPAGE